MQSSTSNVCPNAAMEGVPCTIYWPCWSAPVALGGTPQPVPKVRLLPSGQWYLHSFSDINHYEGLPSASWPQQPQAPMAVGTFPGPSGSCTWS